MCDRDSMDIITVCKSDRSSACGCGMSQTDNDSSTQLGYNTIARNVFSSFENSSPKFPEFLIGRKRGRNFTFNSAREGSNVERQKQQLLRRKDRAREREKNTQFQSSDCQGEEGKDNFLKTTCLPAYLLAGWMIIHEQRRPGVCIRILNSLCARLQKWITHHVQAKQNFKHYMVDRNQKSSTRQLQLIKLGRKIYNTV